MAVVRNCTKSKNSRSRSRNAFDTNLVKEWAASGSANNLELGAKLQLSFDPSYMSWLARDNTNNTLGLSHLHPLFLSVHLLYPHPQILLCTVFCILYSMFCVMFYSLVPFPILLPPTFWTLLLGLFCQQ